MNEIYNLIDNNNIKVLYADIDANGYYLNIKNKPTIIINKDLNHLAERFTVAEEVAHYSVGTTPTLPFADDYYNQLIRSRNEFRAFKWMQDKLIPYDIEKYKYSTLWEISEELEMPPEFIKQAIEYRKENYNG